MQKDVHFYLTYAMCKMLNVKNAELIAWANQFTDECTRPKLYGIQTQSEVLGNWFDKQIQFSVLSVFHFLPGDDEGHPWMTTERCGCAEALMADAMKSEDPFRIGIALHSFQDTFSHQGFSGWQEELNSCFPWYRLPRRSVPNIGHAEMGVIPDMVDYTWTDPRDNSRVDNKDRVSRCISSTYDVLAPMSNKELSKVQVSAAFFRFLLTNSYKERKEELKKISGHPVRFSELTKTYETLYLEQFSKAATEQLRFIMGAVKDLPRKEVEEDE